MYGIRCVPVKLKNSSAVKKDACRHGHSMPPFGFWTWNPMAGVTRPKYFGLKYFISSIIEENAFWSLDFIDIPSSIY